jgi:hypothetical protein
MFRIWREPEVVVRFGGDSIVQSASECEITLADIVRVEPPIWDSFWLCRPQMNGYNVHDGVFEEASATDL